MGRDKSIDVIISNMSIKPFDDDCQSCYIDAETRCRFLRHDRNRSASCGLFGLLDHDANSMIQRNEKCEGIRL
jgi:hypothetical protein